eukprot:gnl/MRDRNA2_/MRDRNA2_99146_c0_seq1.p1 gnl/MRDRNA2_/MRDRNA2_99146_c0~~gnl/MRDRNA2_/MRDRNA2_99146_c0_seq1.p1  ORF type:complete len:411 (-),score=68.08 gnl/MRDRNA2_/MRDRNA2_99146_c0_seq1:171-1403(-)
MIGVQRTIQPVGPRSYKGAWGGGNARGPRGVREASQYDRPLTEAPQWNHANHHVYQPTPSNLMSVAPEPVEEPVVPSRTLKGKEQVRGSPSYVREHGKHGQKGGKDVKHAEVVSVQTLQWFPQTRQYYYGDPTPQRPIHAHYHLPSAEGWLDTYQAPYNIGDEVLGVRWSERNNQDPQNMVVGWVPRFFRLDGYAMQMWRNREEELIGRDYDSGCRPILFWDLRKLSAVELHHREGRKGPLLNLYFRDGGVQFATYSYNDADMWRSACQQIIIQVAMSDGAGDIHDNRGQKLLEMMSHDNDTFSEENLSQLWDAYEQNRDGVLNIDEVKHLMKEMVQQERHQAMHEIRNPRAQQERVQELWQMEQQIDDKFASEVQQKFDTNRDGMVSKTEFMNQAPQIFKGWGRSKGGF